MTTLRRAEPGDAPALAELAERTFRDAFGHLNRAEDVELHCASSYSRDLQAGEIADPLGVTLLCDDEGTLIGFGQLRWGPAPPCVPASRPAEIRRLYVDRQWHGKGVAQSLMAALLEIASAGHADVIWLGTWERNPRGIAFYAKSGFTIVGEQTYVVGHDVQRDLVLARRLGRRSSSSRSPG